MAPGVLATNSRSFSPFACFSSGVMSSKVLPWGGSTFCTFVGSSVFMSRADTLCTVWCTAARKPVTTAPTLPDMGGSGAGGGGVRSIQSSVMLATMPTAMPMVWQVPPADQDGRTGSS